MLTPVKMAPGMLSKQSHKRLPLQESIVLS